MNFSGLLSRPGDGRPAHWELSAPAIEVDLDGQTVAVPAFARELLECARSAGNCRRRRFSTT